MYVSDSIHGPTKLSLDLGFDAFNTGCDIFASYVEKYFSDIQIIHYRQLSDELKMPCWFMKCHFCQAIILKISNGHIH